MELDEETSKTEAEPPLLLDEDSALLCLPELTVYCYLVLATMLVDQKK